MYNKPADSHQASLFGDFESMLNRKRSINVMLAAAAFNFKRVMNLLLYPFRSLANMASGWDLRLMILLILLPPTPRIYIGGWKCAF